MIRCWGDRKLLRGVRALIHKYDRLLQRYGWVTHGLRHIDYFHALLPYQRWPAVDGCSVKSIFKGPVWCKILSWQCFLTTISVSSLSMTSVACSTFQKICAKACSSRSPPLVMSQRGLIVDCHPGVCSAAWWPPSFRPPPNMWRVQHQL